MQINNDLVFTNKDKMPNDTEIKKALNDKITFFRNILKDNEFDETAWKFYSKKSGWTLQCRINKRNILYLQIFETGFYTWFTFGKKAKEDALKSEINEKFKDEIKASKSYKEGTSFKVDVKNEDDVNDVKTLINIKFDN